MNIAAFCTWVQNLPIPTDIRESGFLFPTIETVHVVFLTLVVGSILMLDLRLLGVSSRDRAITEVSAQVLPWTWSCFIGAVITGVLLFTSRATTYWSLYTFRAKMVLIALAGINMMIFHFGAYKTVHHWDNHTRTPNAARFAAALSLIFWILVVFCGRWLGFLSEEMPG